MTDTVNKLSQSVTLAQAIVLMIITIGGAFVSGAVALSAFNTRLSIVELRVSDIAPQAKDYQGLVSRTDKLEFFAQESIADRVNIHKTFDVRETMINDLRDRILRIESKK